MIPLEVEYYEPSASEKHKIKSLTFLRRDFSNSDLNTCYMALFSAFIADIICLYIPLVQYTDLSIVEGFLLFVEKQKGRVSVFYCCNLVYLLVLYTGIFTSFFWKNSLVWDILGNWALVGVLLTVLWLPFNRKYFILNIATSLINLICLKIRSDSKFSNSQVDQTN